MTAKTMLVGCSAMTPEIKRTEERGGTTKTWWEWDDTNEDMKVLANT